ncbi:hypothetical protein PoB_004112900 [Plakobranchus ocellatus]|uniref:Mutator-like transposase domain-containing protein n=1 Tax=Plakobranchus ocellatus TaxID=259542 RepID=A0AAV4B8F2_9GAST|nr:hypothetical protein PoB_004112900 [Plakobranchus ocellatus]
MLRKKRRAEQLTEARAMQERRRAWTSQRESDRELNASTSQGPSVLQHEPHHQPRPEQQRHSEPEPELTVPQTLEEPQPSTSRGDTSLVIPYHPPRTPSSSEEDAEPTRSEKKLALFPEPHADDVANIKRTIVDLTQIEEIVADLRCHHCLSDNGLAMETPIRFGFAIKLVIICRNCGETLSSKFTSARNLNSVSTPKPFVINEAATMSSLLAGMGPYSFRNFCEYMELPGVHPKTFNKIAKRLYSQNEVLGEEVFTQAAGLVRQEHIRQYHLAVEENSLLDIAVSYDGSWLTRGHKSLIGIGCVIDVLTGLIIDGHVLSLYCHIWARTGAWIKRETPQRYDRWFQEHLDSGDCTVNFAGSSGMMEVRIAEVLWGRSIQRYNLRYTTIVSDGDSKSFNRLLELQPYGSDVLITKEDCINHVGKRLGAALRNLVADCSKRGITFGGRGYGRLTAETIRKLQIYYTRGFEVMGQQRR